MAKKLTDKQLAAKLKRFAILKAAESEQKKQMEEIADEIKAAMGDKTELEAGGYKAMISQFPRTSLDSSRLKEEKPKLYDQYAVTKDITSFKVSQA